MTRWAMCLFAAVAVAAGAPAPAAADIDMAALHAAAKKEGALNVYAGGPRAPYLARIARFEAAYPGVKVELVNGPSNVLSERINKARAEGKPHADIAVLQTIQDFVDWKKSGRLAPFKPDAWSAIPAAFKDADGAFTGGVEVARQALARREQEVGERDASLVPFLLTYAGLLYLTSGWSSGRPYYDRAQQLRISPAAHG